MKKRKLSYVVIKSAMAILGLALFACENDVQEVKVIGQNVELPSLSAFDMSVMYTDSTRIQFNLKAPEINKYQKEENPYTEFPQGINVVYFSEYPDTNSMIRSNYAKRYDDELYWEVKGDVVAQNTKGEVLHTEYMIWDEEKEIIHSDKYVKIITKEDVIEGEGFEADQSFSDWKIKKVTGFISIDDEE